MTEHAADLGIDAARISIEGESAGGNLAAATTLMARDRDGPKIIFQVLVDPELDMALIFPSVQEFGHGWGMESSDLKEANKLYFRNIEDATTRYGSPLYAEDLSNLPPRSSSRLSAIPCVMQARRTVVGSGTQALRHLSSVAWGIRTAQESFQR
jgi:acetyl esterase/lipase